MKHFNGKFTGAMLAACMALSTQSVYADCSTQTSTILQSAAAISGAIPFVGPVSDAGFTLADLFVCGPGAEPLDVATVVNLIRTELDANAFTQTKQNVQDIAKAIKRLADDLQTDPLFAGANLESLTPFQQNIITARVELIVGDIGLAENVFFAALATPNNLRQDYDLALPTLLANYKLGLVQLARSADPKSDDLGEDVANKILDNFADYQKESDRLRDLTYAITIKQSGLNNSSYEVHADLTIKRQGQTLFFKREQCTGQGILSGDDPSCTTGGQQAIAEETAFVEITKRLNKLDLQDETHLALLKAKAQALLGDPGVDFASVALPTPATRVMLMNAHPNADNRCAFMRAGGVNVTDGSLTQGSTRMRGCDPLVSRSSVLLKANGQIRSSIADLCLEATDSENKVFFRPCDDSLMQQRWKRDGDRFKLSPKIAGVSFTRCLSPRPDHISSTDETFRHVACTDSSAQQWYVFSPFENKALPSGVDPITPDSEDFGVKADPTLCLGYGEFNSDIGYREPALTACDRYRKEVLWAQGALGELRPLLSPNQILDGRFQGAPRVLKSESNTGNGGQYIRDDAGDGTVTFLLKKDSGRYLFPDFADEGALVFADIAPTDGFGNFDDVVFWKHFNGGKWAK